MKNKQREIKFRAWDKTNKKWMDLYHSEVALNPNTGKLVHVDDLSTSYWDFNEYVLMQYTGLKDNNGKEIYEGDIVADRQYGTNKLILPKVVVFDEFGVSTDPGSGYAFVMGWGMKDINGEVQNLDIKLEVIGNIYENPELLK